MSVSPPEAPQPGAARLLADAAAAERDARLRLDAAIVDLALPGPSRLSDYQRAAVARMSEHLVGEIESRLAPVMAERLGTAAPAELTAAHVPLALPRLEAARLLHDPELVALLLRRAAEHRLARRLRRGGGADPADALLHDAAADVAEATGALLVAEARRYDDFQDAAVPAADLPAELVHRLVWMVAAAIRAELVGRHGLDEGTVDRAAAVAAQRLLAGHDEAAALDGRARALARALDRAGRLDDAALAGLAERGHVALTVAALAHRAGVDLGGAWDMALDPAGSRLALLLRAAAVGDHGAARVLAAWLHHPRDAGEVGEDLREVDAETAHAATQLWRLDPAYRAAILALA